MNKKIFTLFVGAMLSIGSLLTTSAQTPTLTVHEKKPDWGTTSFSDTLRADTAFTYVKGTADQLAYYVLSVTEIANPDASLAPLASAIAGAGTSLQNSFVLFLDADGRLRLDTLSVVDTKYGFTYNGNPSKFGAIRAASWCVSTTELGTVGPNVIWDFKNMETGELLEAPLPDYDIAGNLWQASSEGHGRKFFKGEDPLNPYKGINLVGDEDLIVSGWHFSESWAPGQLLQTGMPIYSWVTDKTGEEDSVLVLTIENPTVYASAPAGTRLGGYVVTVKYVSSNDLIKDHIGNVRRPGDAGGTPVNNVLLFTLKKLQPFVLNAEDYNAVSCDITFTPDAKVKTEGVTGWNPFTSPDPSDAPRYLDPYSRYGCLTAYEVSDSLYRYGYLYLQAPLTTYPATSYYTPGGWLYVDTAFLNEGNKTDLKFNWSEYVRDSSAHADGQFGNPAPGGGFPWGLSLTFDGSGASSYYSTYLSNNPGAYKPDSVLYFENTGFGTPAGSSEPPHGVVYWKYDELVWTVVDYFAAFNPGVVNPDGTINTTATFPSAVYTWADIFGTLTTAEFDDIIALYTQFGGTSNYFGGTSSTVISALSIAIADLSTIFTGTISTPVGDEYVERPEAGETKISYAEAAAIDQAFHSDSLLYILKFNTDSLMENQAKFRVVHDPFIDSTWINVYQTRVRYENYAGGVITTGPWWENSFRPVAGAAWTHPSDVWGSNFAYYAAENVRNVPADHISYGPNIGADFYHTYGEWYPSSSPTNQDKVMISTADTSVFYFYGVPLGHIYGWNDSTYQGMAARFQDSLFYVDIRDLYQSQERVVTLDQSYNAGNKQLNTQIRLGYASACTATDDNPKATIGNDLYLIRNAKGEYLCVPIWSITCQAYWVTPRDYEDPTRMPCYQWAIENKRAGAGSPFKLTNREFEHVSLPYAYVFASNTEPLYYQGGSGLSAWAAYDPTMGGSVGDPTNIVYAGVVPASKAIGKGQFATIEQLYPFKSTKYSFFPLAADVKSDQLLGYNYIDADSALVDVYAFKYRHYAATGADARYVGWEGYSTGGADTTVYVVYNRPSDRLFFSLEEMPLDIIQDWVWINKDYDYTDNLKPYYVPNGGLFGYRRAGYNDYEDYKSIYNLNVLGKSNLGYNQNGITLEHFGYMPTKYNTTIGNDVYKYYTEGIVGIPDLKPLARQAYRLLLKDYYKFHPTVKGDYLTVGAQDNYVLADNDLVGIKYTPGITDDPSGMFGTPYYYFRNTYFDVPGVSAQGDAVTQTYFAVIQRLDTLTLYTSSNGAFSTPYSDVLQYITVRFGASAATQIASAVEDSHELGVFIWDVEEHDKVRLKVTTRGEAAYRLNTFTLERDTDPIYRRFHWNEPDYSFPRTLSDEPLILEFHTLGNEKVKLFENSGADKTSGGGYEYNCPTLSDGTLGDQFTDSLGNIISFLGVKNISTHPSVVLPDKWGLNEYANNRDVKVKGTNYWFYVDTAYINRGTGWIKPQYMLVVDPKIVPDESVCADTNPSTTPTTYKGYVIGRYMYNTAMYAKKIVPLFEDDYEYGQWIYAADGTTKISPITGTGINYDLVQPIEDKLTAVVNPQYMENVKITARGEVIPGGWERIAFSWAIHVGDELFILKGAAPFYKEQLPDVELLIADLSKYYGPDNGRCIDFAKLRAVKGLPLSSINAPIGVHAIIDLSNNQHKDWVWSFRYVERGSSNFVIESETTDRDRLQGKEIRPGYGGWVKIDLDMIPGITRNDMRPDLMGEGDIFDVKDKTAEVEISDVVANESLSVVKVIGGNGEVTITNAAGKTVVVNNILGQTLTNTTISSDKATFKVPAGIVFVSVEGEKSVKALVK